MPPNKYECLTGVFMIISRGEQRNRIANIICQKHIYNLWKTPIVSEIIKNSVIELARKICLIFLFSVGVVGDSLYSKTMV